MAIKTADNSRPIKLKTKREKPGIQSVEQLRDNVLIALDRLEAYEISIEEAGVIGKLCESVMSTVKAQLEYSKMLGRKEEIGFLKIEAKPEQVEYNDA